VAVIKVGAATETEMRRRRRGSRGVGTVVELTVVRAEEKRKGEGAACGG
jgi:hypothetical protein